MTERRPETPSTPVKSPDRSSSAEGEKVTVEKTRLEKAVAISNVLSIWVTIFALMIAAGWTLREYRQNQKDQQIDRVFEFARRAESTLISEARKAVFLAWDEAEADLIRLIDPNNSTNKKLSPVELESKLEIFTLDVIRNKIYYETLSLVNFFNNLAICVKRKLCDAETAYDYFGSEILSFKNLHLSFILGLRQRTGWRNPTYGEDLIDFSRAYRRRRDTLQLPSV